ncbi:hypothetical protein OAU68_02165 [Litorivicinus sp.]|nr:hypothetical protein [Litorivicinus sp.]
MTTTEEVFINGDGETSRDVCYIDNAVQINIISAMAQREEARARVYNCALNDRTSLNELYKVIGDLLMERVEGLEVDQPTYREFRPGDVGHSLADISKTQRLVGSVEVGV